MPLSAVIVDDEQLARDELAYLLKNLDDVNVVAQGKNGLEAISLIREHNPDLVFLDVQMPGLDGFGVIKKLLDRKVPLPKIIFATAFDQYAVKAFEVNAVDYILKPFDKKRVVQSIERARAKIEAGAGPEEKLETLMRMLESQKPQTAKILIKAAGRLFLADPKDICYATIEDGVITVATSGPFALSRWNSAVPPLPALATRTLTCVTNEPKSTFRYTAYAPWLMYPGTPPPQEDVLQSRVLGRSGELTGVARKQK